jgi:hypothetical protein
MAIGRPVRPATASALIAAGVALTGSPPSDWDADVFEALAWFGLVAWFRARGEDVPDDCGRALTNLARHLDPEGRRGLVDVLAGVIGPVDAAPPARPLSA